MDELEDLDIIIEIPIVEPPEFRLYYDDNGSVICYTCEKLEGKYIVVSSDIFAQGRPDIKVIDGKIQEKITGMVLSVMEESTQGTRTSSEDVAIVVSEDYTGATKYWELKHYEL